MVAKGRESAGTIVWEEVIREYLNLMPRNVNI